LPECTADPVSAVRIVTVAPEGWELMLTVLGPLWTIEAQPPAARQAPVMTNVVRAFFMDVFFFWGGKDDTLRW
jgi:hypothetical protein